MYISKVHAKQQNLDTARSKSILHFSYMILAKATHLVLKGEARTNSFQKERGHAITYKVRAKILTKNC